MTLPGRCMGCGTLVEWSGLSWVNRGKARRHVCKADRPACGAYMPLSRERCARHPGHVTEHRTAYAMANAYRARMGRERAS